MWIAGDNKFGRVETDRRKKMNKEKAEKAKTHFNRWGKNGIAKTPIGSESK